MISIFVRQIPAALACVAIAHALPDSDGDGYPDLQELAQGLPAFGPNGGRGNPAVATRENVSGSEYSAVQFRCLPGVIHGFGYQVQESPDFQSWSDLDMFANRVGSVLSINDGSPIDLMTIRANQPISAATRAFLRVSISPPWPPDDIRFATVNLSNINTHIRLSVFDIVPANTLTKQIFDSYDPTSDALWSRFGWTNKVDLSGVPFNSGNAGVLISPRHILMATHAARAIGTDVVFHDRSGHQVTRTLIDRESVPGGLNPDITVGLLSADVASKFYRVLPPRNDWGTYLLNGLALATDQEPKLLVKNIAFVGGATNPYISFSNSPDVDDFYDEILIPGDSGNPSFIMVRGEPVAIETHTFGGAGTGPFFSTVANFTAINSIMSTLGGGYQLTPVFLNP